MTSKTPEGDSVPERIAAAAHELSDRVKALSGQLEISENQVKKVRFLTILSTGIAVLAMIGMVISAYLFVQVKHTTQANKDNQVTNCQNANKTREAQRTLWAFIIEVSSSPNDGSPPTPQQQKFLDDLQLWINQIFAERDCSNLSKEYTLPDPPAIPKVTS